MKITELNLTDESRNRKIPILIYLPEESKQNLQVVIFNPGYQDQVDLQKPETILAYRKWEYLAQYFNNKNCAFIAIQHDLPGDADGLETIDPKLPQVEARKHLWIRGEQNILFVINLLKAQFPNLDFNQFIIAGHSNGADMAKFFANKYQENISHVISFDGRRCPIAPLTKQKLLMFEAIDTSTDVGVLPNEGTKDSPNRMNLEWLIFKPSQAFHTSYRGDIIRHC
jgi:hypothetical protein